MLAIDAHLWNSANMKPAAPPPPRYIRITGGLTVIIGTGVFIWFPYTMNPAFARSIGVAMVVGGIGLVFGQRWAWPFVVLTAIPMFAVGFVFFMPSEATDPYDLVPLVGVPFLLVGCLILVASVTRSTRAWLLAKPSGARART